MAQGKDAVQGYFALRSDFVIGGPWAWARPVEA